MSNGAFSMSMRDAHCREATEVAAYYHVDVNTGLSEQEVAQARTKYGKNELEPEQSTPLWKLILKQFDDLLVKILLAAAIVDFIIAMSEGESIVSGMVEPMVILLILIANATVGVVTERSAEKAIEELRAYEAESAMVLRGSKVREVPACELVPGDIIEVSVGCKVPADVRVITIYTSQLKIDQSLLTGESVAAEKHIEAVSSQHAVYQDKTNILFSGTLVVAGRARGIVVGTGTSTAFGKIRDAMMDTPEVITPLKAKLDEFGELLSKVIAVICVLVWVININRFKDPALGGWVSGAIHYFKIAVALAVAAIPEGLPAVVTTCLALGTRRMAKRNAIVRTLPSVETLGCTTVICTDKTGTLTTNQMCVVKVAVVQSSGGQLAEYDVMGTSFSKHGSIIAPGGVSLRQPADTPCLMQAAIACAVCNDSLVSWNREQGIMQHIGDPTEVALRVFTEKVGLPSSLVTPFHALSASNPGYGPQDGGAGSGGNAQQEFTSNAHWAEQFGRLGLLEFSRDRKMMSVLASGGPNGGRPQLWAKGAPEGVLARCTSALANNGEGVVPLTDIARTAILADLQSFAGRHALRCLALAVKQMPANQQTVSAEDEVNLTFVGLVGMHDPPRLECKAAIETCRLAGIRVVMVTGDNKATAEAVAKQVGALSNWTPAPSSPTAEGLPPISLTGVEFDALGPMGQAAAAGSLQVFSRVEPLHKLKLVELLQAQGHVVAMTGDGVNDAPALMRSDIGVAMGSGTSVAKSAADMVLADDNFATIVFAVAEGRAIYNNTKQFIRYMISSNIGEVVAIFVAALLGMPEVLTPVQLLWVNLVTDGLPATALGLNKPDRDLMAQPPRRVGEPIVNGWLFIRYLVVGSYVGLVTVAGFVWWFLAYEQGGNITWHQLTHFQACDKMPGGKKLCAVFLSRHPSTISMSVLVVVEMFNALNNLSEDASLLRVPPWDNQWLLGAIATSMLLHGFILYFPPAAAVFGVTPLSWAEWRMVLLLSAPVVLVDEVMKWLSRRRRAAAAAGGGGGGGEYMTVLGLSGITVSNGGAGSEKPGTYKLH